MRTILTFSSLSLFPLLTLGCPDEVPPVETCDFEEEQAGVPNVVPGAPEAGVAETFVDLPVGTPLSGYTSRCSCFGGEGKADRRDSQYRSEFAPSAGVQTRVSTKAFWLTNSDQDLVILKLDVIYSFDGLVEALERSIEAETGRPMDGKVVLATNHSHSSYGDFSDQVTYYLGSDRFNREVFERLVETMTATAVEAFDTKQAAKIGVSRAKDWDEGRVYHDRRGDNDDIQVFPDIPAGSYRDPYLTLIRIDTLADEPLGVLFNFGMHGTTLDGDSPMISVDAPGHVELAFEEMFDTPVVVAMLQGAGGDSTPGGSDSFYAQLESIGEYAAQPIYDVWAKTPTASDPIRLETASRSIGETHDEIRVTRGGTVDWKYTPFEEGLVPDNEVYASDGSILSPIDEFNVQYGGAFCGEDPAYLPGYAPAQAFPYVNCVDVDKMVDLIQGFFDLTAEEAALPLAESTKAGVTATRFGPVPILQWDGTQVTDDFLIGFFPGETTAMYTEQFRRRAAAELGFENSMAVGYAQDHEGYLLIPEDWLQGGYEADINIWGPLQGEHIMEGLLTMSDEILLTDRVEKPDPCDTFGIPDYGVETPLPTARPDASPEAGTWLDAPPAYLYSPLYTEDEVEAGSVPELGIPAEVQRVSGLVQFAWIGGDPGVDFPLVSLERQADDGSWSVVTTQAGRPVTQGYDIIVTTTPDPLTPDDVQSTWTWYAAWQAVGHSGEDRTGLPEGNYRFLIEGNSFVDDGATTWPWKSEAYVINSPEFRLVPAPLTVGVSGSDITAHFTSPARGYRLVGLDGNVRGTNPIASDTATLSFEMGDGSFTTLDATGVRGGGYTTFSGVVPAGSVSVTVTDVYGNTGSLALGG